MEAGAEALDEHVLFWNTAQEYQLVLATTSIRAKKGMLATRRQQLSRRLKSAVGLAAGEDEEVAAARKVFGEMQRDLEVVGAGLSEQVRLLKNYYETEEKLAAVVAAYHAGGDRNAEWAALGGSCHHEAWAEPASKTWAERCAYLNHVARRSAAALIVEHGLDPMREVARRVGDVKKALDAYDLAVAAREVAEKKKKENLDGARRDETSRRGEALAAVEGILAAFDAAVVDAACVLAATQAELYSATAEYVNEACEKLTPAVSEKFRGQVLDLVKVGGPALVERERSRARKAYELISGRKQLDDYRREREEAERRRKLQAAQFERALAEPTRKPVESGKVPEVSSTQTRRIVRALFDCAGEEDGELSFAKDAKFALLDDSHPDWWTGRLDDGTVGFFPANYVVELDAEEPTAKANVPPPPPAPRKADALYDCVAEGPNDLAFRAGDELEVLSLSGDWWLARRQDGAKGQVPSNYLKLRDVAPP